MYKEYNSNLNDTMEKSQPKPVYGTLYWTNDLVS